MWWFILLAIAGVMGIVWASNISGERAKVLIKEETDFVQVVTKRIKVQNGGHYTYYFITFESENHGNRFELQVPEIECGLIVEGDRGTLRYTSETNFQDKKFVKFERKIEKNNEEEVGKY